MDVRISEIRACIDLETSDKEEVQICESSVCHLLTGMDCPPQTWHIDFEYRKKTNNGKVFLFTGNKFIRTCTGHVSQCFVKHSEPANALFVKRLKLEFVVTEKFHLHPPYIFDKRGPGWKG